MVGISIKSMGLINQLASTSINKRHHLVIIIFAKSVATIKASIRTFLVQLHPWKCKLQLQRASYQEMVPARQFCPNVGIQDVATKRQFGTDSKHSSCLMFFETNVRLLHRFLIQSLHPHPIFALLRLSVVHNGSSHVIQVFDRTPGKPM